MNAHDILGPIPELPEPVGTDGQRFLVAGYRNYDPNYQGNWEGIVVDRELGNIYRSYRRTRFGAVLASTWRAVRESIAVAWHDTKA